MTDPDSAKPEPDAPDGLRLTSALPLGDVVAPNRVLFGPHVTNLGADDRSLTERHVAYYARRAAGGCAVVVVEGASVHESDWPYERAPLAARCGAGWRAIGDAVHAHGSLAIASLDHAGGQGSSAYSQAPLWAPSRVPEVNSREVPKWMERADIAAVVAGFAAGTKGAMDAGLDGVEINVGQHSLIRQFVSGLTNQRDDEWGHDKLLFARHVIDAVIDVCRSPDGGDRNFLVGLRLSCDELAPWAGITPEMATEIAVELAATGIDYLVVTRGAIYSTEKTRPDFHEPTGFNIDVCRAVRAALRDSGNNIPVYLQGSIVEWGQAEWALGGFDDPAVADGVEMTRAQIADPDLCAKLTDGMYDQIRPCTRCNQTCQVRDARNPIVTCVGEPTSGRETEDPDWYASATQPRHVTVIGAGIAGLETARVAKLRGHDVKIIEQSDALGGVAAVAGPHRELVEWYRREHQRLGTPIELGTEYGPTVPSPSPHPSATSRSTPTHPHGIVVQCTGSMPGVRDYEVADDSVPVVDIIEIRRGSELPDGSIAIFDPIGGPIAVALAEELGDRAVLITQDNIAGNELSRTGDLAPANSRLQQRNVQIERRSLLRGVTAAGVELEDRFNGERRIVPCAALVDCGFRLPTPKLDGATHVAGDAIAPRTVLEAVLEGRRAASAL